MEYLNFILGITILLLFTILTGLYFLSMINGFRFKVPQVGTFSSDFRVMKKGLKKYNLEGKTIVDLGSGSGKVLRFFEKIFKSKTTGFEVDLSNVLISKFFNLIFKCNSSIKLGNYFKRDISDFDFIYVYLYPVLMEDLEKKIWSESKKGTYIFSNAFQFTNRKTIEILYDEKGKEELYIYKI